MKNNSKEQTKGIMKKSVIAMALALGLSAVMTQAQDDNQRPPGGDKPQNEGGHRRGPGGGAPGNVGGGPGGQRPPLPPVIAALDANHDGTIDETELSQATEHLKALDKNGDGKLSGDEIRPQMGSRPGGQRPEGGQNSPGGNRDGGQQRRGPRPDGGQNGADGDQHRGPRPGGGQGGQNSGGPQGDHKPMLPPLIKALDANGDGVIDETELSQAADHLKALDKNGDGKLSRDEVGPANRQHGPGGQPGQPKSDQ